MPDLIHQIENCSFFSPLLYQPKEIKMKATIETQISIQATPQQVWNVLMDVEQYPEWNPFVKKLVGKLAV